MNIRSSSTTIYVGNIQSIRDDQLKEYFERFGRIEAFYHNCTRAADEWLIDYRFIRFSSDTDMNIFLTNKIDHMISRIRLDIYPYDAAFQDETRLTLDRKICIAHTDPKLDRNVVKKAFNKYGRILNCTCVSSGNGVEYVYIEFETINSVRSVFASGQRHFAGRSSLAVKQALRPSQVGVKMECISVNETDQRESSTNRPISRYTHNERLNLPVDTAQYSSFLVNRHNSIINDELRMSTPTPEQSLNHLSELHRRLSTISNNQTSNYNKNVIISTNIEQAQSSSQEQLKDYELEYGLIIRQDLDEITYQIDKFLQNQQKSYKKLHKFIRTELRSQSSSSSSSEDGEIESTSSSDFENFRHDQVKKRIKSHH